MDRCTDAQFYLWTGQVINVAKNPVDVVEYEELGGHATVSEVLDCDLVDVTGFPGLHLIVQNMVKLGQCHWRQLEGVFSVKFKDVNVVIVWPFQQWNFFHIYAFLCVHKVPEDFI